MKPRTVRILQMLTSPEGRVGYGKDRQDILTKLRMQGDECSEQDVTGCLSYMGRKGWVRNEKGRLVWPGGGCVRYTWIVTEEGILHGMGVEDRDEPVRVGQDEGAQVSQQEILEDELEGTMEAALDNQDRIRDQEVRILNLENQMIELKRVLEEVREALRSV